MTDSLSVSADDHTHAGARAHHSYLLGPILSFFPAGPALTVLDVGCGNGYLTNQYAQQGYRAIGIDIGNGIKVARAAFPAVTFHRASVYDDLSAIVPATGVDVIVASEVIEHLYRPDPFLTAMRKHLS